jgi:2-amino-4-deoxychorismate synthase
VDSDGLSEQDARPDTLLAKVLGDSAPPFSLVYRPGTSDGIEVLLGQVVEYESLADLPVAGPGGPEMLVLLPYRQILERGFACRDDGEPILGMVIDEHAVADFDRTLARLPDLPVVVRGGRFDSSDEDYADIVDTVIRTEIGRGAGSNFVIKRSFVCAIDDFSVQKALSIFKRLLLSERGSYWTFIVHTGKRTFVGATPEGHVRLRAGLITMNPISGTYRYPPAGPNVAGLLEFLTDQKETDELCMVLDEELKMMAKLCVHGGRVRGPMLKEMAYLAHTEYLINGRSELGVADILRETMFAPTVTGSPLVNACRVLARHEATGRGFYSGVIALIGRDSAGRPTMDSGIVIRSADIGADGLFRLSVGSTVVRDSDPASEAQETRRKAAGVLAAFGAMEAPCPPAGLPERFGENPRIRKALLARNSTLSRFWIGSPRVRRGDAGLLAALRVLVIDAEDDFTAMLAHQLRAVGVDVAIRLCSDELDESRWDLVVVGPGPGDPGDDSDPRIRALTAICDRLLSSSIPFVAECLGHQVIASLLGLRLECQDRPSQGHQAEIKLFGGRERVGFYNTFSARHDTDWLRRPGHRGPVELSRDDVTGQVHAMRGNGFASVQFHLESVLTERGDRILKELLTWCLSSRWPG